MTGKFFAAPTSRKGWWLGIGMIALAACSSDGLGDLRPPADVGSQTASIEPSQTATSMTRVEQEMVAPAEPVPTASEPFPTVEQEMTESAPQMSFPADETVDEPIIRGAPERQLAQAFPPIENPASTLSDAQPDMSTEQTYETDPEFEQEPDAPLTAEPEETPQPSPRQAMVAYPRIPSPMPAEPDDPPLRPRATPLSSDEIQCRQKLKKLGVRYVDLKPIYDGPSCQIPHPVKLQAIGSVEMRPAATLTCAMAASFAAWTRNELVPSSRLRYFSGIQTIHQGSAYSCRRIARSRTMSAHSQGNALDVMALTLNNGKKIDVKKQGLFSFRARGLLNNVRSDGCEYFTTVLGPGYNWDHRNHFHFDLMQRKSGRRACH